MVPSKCRSTFFIAVASAVCVSFIAPSVWAQSAPAGARYDILGIRLGQPLPDAIAALKFSRNRTLTPGGDIVELV